MEQFIINLMPAVVGVVSGLLCWNLIPGASIAACSVVVAGTYFAAHHWLNVQSPVTEADCQRKASNAKRRIGQLCGHFGITTPDVYVQPLDCAGLYYDATKQSNARIFLDPSATTATEIHEVAHHLDRHRGIVRAEPPATLKEVRAKAKSIRKNT